MNTTQLPSFAPFDEAKWLEEQNNTPTTHLSANVQGIMGFLVIRDPSGNYRMIFSTDQDNGEANYFITISPSDWFFDKPLEKWKSGRTVYNTRTHVNYIIYETDNPSFKILERVN